MFGGGRGVPDAYPCLPFPSDPLKSHFGGAL